MCVCVLTLRLESSGTFGTREQRERERERERKREHVLRGHKGQEPHLKGVVPFLIDRSRNTHKYKTTRAYLYDDSLTLSGPERVIGLLALGPVDSSLSVSLSLQVRPTMTTNSQQQKCAPRA
jgi:hypothetical protein